jgi:hypothetical protein
MIKISWGIHEQNKTIHQPTSWEGNFITLEQVDDHASQLGKKPSEDALLMCESIRQQKINEHIRELAGIPQKKIVSKFSGIIRSPSKGLPVLYDEEMLPVVINGTSFDPLPNVLGRMMTKHTLLMIIKNESPKLNIWLQLEQQWKDVYCLETKTYVSIIRALAGHCAKSGQNEKAAELFASVERIKEVNRQYVINW